MHETRRLWRSATTAGAAAAAVSIAGTVANKGVDLAAHGCAIVQPLTARKGWLTAQSGGVEGGGRLAGALQGRRLTSVASREACWSSSKKGVTMCHSDHSQ